MRVRSANGGLAIKWDAEERGLHDIGDGLGAAGKAASCFLGPALDGTGVYYSATKKGAN